MFAVFGRVREAARMMQPWRLREGGGEGRGGRWRSCEFGDDGVDIAPDDFIGLVVEDHSKER